jgi:hypothetical protein
MASVTHPPNRRGLPRVRAVVLVAAVIATTAVGFLFLVPVPHSVSAQSSITMPLPYNTSESNCAWAALGDRGSYTFTVNFVNGNVIFLTVTGPTNTTAFRGFGDSSISGTIDGISSGAYEFCLASPVNYSYEGGSATLHGTLTYSTVYPIL